MSESRWSMGSEWQEWDGHHGAHSPYGTFGTSGISEPSQVTGVLMSSPGPCLTVYNDRQNLISLIVKSQQSMGDDVPIL